MTLPPLTYLTTDSMSEGVGASQVAAYVERLADRGVDVRLHSFEKTAPTHELRQRLARRGVRWTPHPFGSLGPRGGVQRVATGARAVRGASLVHARSDLSAASALLARNGCWLWDVRSLWADQRIALGALREGSAEHRVLGRVEGLSARRASAVVTLSAAVLPVLEQRHGAGVVDRATVIPTCVDLDRFSVSPLPDSGSVELLLAGTLNAYYDVPLMTRFVAAGRRRRQVGFTVLAPEATAWEGILGGAGASRRRATPAEMPAHLAASHAGLSVCRTDAGVSLTAAMPTKIAEFLAVGRPVVVNPGLGDADVLLEQAGAGVVLGDGSEAGLSAAWDRLDALLADPETPGRCRALAARHFDVDRAVDRLIQVYEGMAQGRAPLTG